MPTFELAAATGMAPEPDSTPHQSTLDRPEKCGPQTIPLYDCGGLAYLYCLKAPGHDGQHTP
jgi:hypothetical protein